jgi:hypothetical protein
VQLEVRISLPHALGIGLPRSKEDPAQQGEPSARVVTIVSPEEALSRGVIGCNDFATDNAVDRRFVLAPGLQWRNAGDKKPSKGEELTHERLAAALERTTQFTHEEWNAFGIANLRINHFIQSGASYFLPVTWELSSVNEHHEALTAGKDKAGEATDGFFFLKNAFGVLFLNMSNGPERGDEPKVTGPNKYADLKIDKEGVLSGVWKIEACFQHEANLRDFPFDTIAWDVRLAVLGYSVGLLKFSRSPGSELRSFDMFDTFGLRGGAQLADAWECDHLQMGVVPNRARISESVVFGRFYTRRKPFDVLTNVVLPIALVSGLCEIAVFTAAGEAEADTDALAFLGTALLTIVAMKFAVADQLPKLQYLTILDKYITAMFSLIAVFMLICGTAARRPSWLARPVQLQAE